MTNSEIKEYDCFISHASEDKEVFVRRLAEVLTDRGLRVWYDEYELTIGDSLNESIAKGLSNSVCGIVVLSKSFMNKNWTSHELNGLVARQNSNGQKIILPIWHNITREELINYSPTLADLVAGNSDSDIQTLARNIESKIQKIKNSSIDISLDVQNSVNNDSEADNIPSQEQGIQELVQLIEKLIVDKKNRIILSKIINAEVDKLITNLKNDFENMAKVQPTKEYIYSKMKSYDIMLERVLNLKLALT